MKKFNISSPRFSAKEKKPEVYFRIFEDDDNFSIYVWNRSYQIRGFQFYLLNADIKNPSRGFGGISSQYIFDVIFSKSGIVYGIPQSVHSIFPSHSTVDTSDGFSAKFTLLTTVSKDSIGYNEKEDPICITDAKILVDGTDGEVIKKSASGDCGLFGLDRKTLHNIPRISKEKIMSAKKGDK
jgi:hypothetical protein